MKFGWITSGAGTWNDREIALHLAKRNAKIDQLDFEYIGYAERWPIELVSREVLVAKSGGRGLKCYGIMSVTDEHPHLSATIGVIPAGKNSEVHYSLSYKPDPAASTERVKDYLIRSFEVENKTKAADPRTNTVFISKRDKTFLSAVAVLLTWDSPEVISDLDYDKATLDKIKMPR